MKLNFENLSFAIKEHSSNNDKLMSNKNLVMSDEDDKAMMTDVRDTEGCPWVCPVHRAPCSVV